MTSTPELLYPADTPMQVLEKMRPFRELMMLYECAMREVSTKFEVLNAEFSVRYNHNPLEAIKTRLKTPLSIAEKLQRNGKPLSVDSIRENLFDVAGVRIICSFPEDIYSLSRYVSPAGRREAAQAEGLHCRPEGERLSQPAPDRRGADLSHRADATHPRGGPVPHDCDGTSWATLEHKTRYKQNIKDEPFIAAELKTCADQIAKLDIRMQEIHKYIEHKE